jgi:hypothetical protein
MAFLFRRDVMTSKSKTVNERRKRQRFGINAPLTVMIGQREIPGFTRDLSNRGVYFYLDMAENAPIGGDFEFMVELPPEITLSTCCTIHCLGAMWCARTKLPGS